MVRRKSHGFPGPLVGAILLVGGLLPGCGTEGDPARPELDGAYPLSQASEAWSLVASQWVVPGNVVQVCGSRYKLYFSARSVAESTLVTISERDPNEADVELGPHGTRFHAGVVLQIDYTGTSSDPDTPTYHGRRPAIFHFHPDTGVWEEIPSRPNPGAKKITAILYHFSRYSMFDPTRSGEWQWESAGPRVAIGHKKRATQ